MELNGDWDDDDDKLVFETDLKDEYNADADLLSQEADAHTELLFGLLFRPGLACPEGTSSTH